MNGDIPIPLVIKKTVVIGHVIKHIGMVWQFEAFSLVLLRPCPVLYVCMYGYIGMNKYRNNTYIKERQTRQYSESPD